MSSILKALRKVEDEKAALGQGSADLAHNILKRSYVERTAFNGWILLVALAGLGFASAAVWLIFSSGTGVKSVSITAPLSVPDEVVSLPSENKFMELAVSPSDNGVTVKADKLSQPPDEPELVGAEPIIIPALQVEEIVFHEQADSRMAVVNDLPVMEGTDIEGARIEKILPDRVQFLYKGVHFYKYKLIAK